MDCVMGSVREQMRGRGEGGGGGPQLSSGKKNT